MRRILLFLFLTLILAVSAVFAQTTADDYFNRAVNRQKEGDTDGALAYRAQKRPALAVSDEKNTAVMEAKAEARP